MTKKTQANDLVVGCIIDYISNVIAFTKNGVPVEVPYYFGPKTQFGSLLDSMPTIVISPGSNTSRDVQLPSLKMRFIFDNSSFKYQGDIRHLVWELPKIKNSNSGILIKDYEIET